MAQFYALIILVNVKRPTNLEILLNYLKVSLIKSDIIENLPFPFIDLIDDETLF